MNQIPSDLIMDDQLRTLLVRLETIQRTIASWRTWNEKERTQEGLSTPKDTHIMHVPVWPTHGQFEIWEETLLQAMKWLGFLSFQERVDVWIRECFSKDIVECEEERNRRFLEESLELVQSCGMTREHAHWMVDYVFNRDIGEKPQEVGGVGVCLAALCNTHGINLVDALETELTRVGPLTEKIRAKQAAKPKYIPEVKQNE